MINIRFQESPSTEGLSSYVHQNEGNSLDVKLEFNGDFEDSVAVYVEGESA